MRRTPSLTGTSDKRPNGVPPSKQDPKSLQEKESHMRKVGTQLKHGADNALKGRRSPSSSNAKDSRPHSSKGEQSNLKMGCMLGIESILCFMQAFQASGALRALHGRKPDAVGWQSLFPLSDYILSELQRTEPRRNRPLHALLLLLQVYAADEVIRCNLALEPGSQQAAEVVKYERLRSRALAQIRDLHNSIDDARLRPNTTAWATLDDITETALRVMRRWCHEEEVDWTTEMSPRDYGR